MIVLLLSLLISPKVLAEAEVSSKGELRLENRFFNNDDQASTQDFGSGLAGRLEVDRSSGNWNQRIQLFSRVDRKDSTRQRMNIEEAYVQYLSENWVFAGGYKTLNWSTAEAFHPTDIINSRNFDGPLENAEKIGELMLSAQYLSESFNLFAAIMPNLARPQLPMSSNRLSFAPQGIAVEEVQFVNNDGEIKEIDDFVSQWALRGQFLIDDWELNLYWVHHFDRTDFQPLINLTNGQLVPLLSEVDHYGLSFQYVWDSLIIKSENVYRNFQEQTQISSFNNQLIRRDYGMSSLALEYLMPHESGSETTLILEFQSLLGVDKNFRYNINPFQRDLLVAARHAFNDVKGKEIFLALISDVERGREILASISYSQRLSDVWKIKLGARYIDAPPSSNIDFTGMRPLNNDHQLDITISRFF